MKERRIWHRIVVLAAVLLFSFSMQTLAANIIMIPELIYTGETAQLKVDPDGCWFVAAGASGINKQYKKYFRLLRGKDGHFTAIKALKKGGYTKIIKGAIQPGNVRRSLIFRCKAPFFKATLRGKEFTDNEAFSINIADEMKVELVSNNQAPVKWTVPDSGCVTVVSTDNSSVTLKGAAPGRCKLTAKYLGYEYSVMINVKQGYGSMLDKLGELLGNYAG